MFDAAPLYLHLADAPDDGRAVWAKASDGLRLRIGLWDKGPKGTVLMLPGRTEYIEKYGRVIGEFHKRGYAVAVIDFRGQGLSDRLLENRRMGHVRKFTDYQLDMNAMVATARKAGLPEPYYMVSHSMGGCIGMRSIMDGLQVRATAFSAPMWGITITPPMRQVAWAISTLARPTRYSRKFSPGEDAHAYVLEAPFDINMLTTDLEHYQWMQTHVREVPDTIVGGPSILWLNEALWEMRKIAARPAPNLPAICFLGTDEQIVDPKRIYDRCNNWDQCELTVIEGARHEILMERNATRQRFFDDADKLFQSVA